MINNLNYFESLLEERFKIDKNISEDTIRYLFFSSLILSNSAKPNDIFLEYPHPQIDKAKIDTYINFKNEKPNWIIEFKFDREIPSKKNSPRTMKAGKLFNDLYRLKTCNINENSRYFFIYVTDPEMFYYLNNENNGLKSFFNLQVERNLHINNFYLEGKSKTFEDQFPKNFSCNIKSLYSKDFNNNYFVRIYEIFN